VNYFGIAAFVLIFCSWKNLRWIGVFSVHGRLRNNRQKLGRRRGGPRNSGLNQ